MSAELFIATLKYVIWKVCFSDLSVYMYGKKK